MKNQNQNRPKRRLRKRAVTAAVAPKQHRPKRYLRRRAVAERYAVHERSVDRMAHDGRLPPPKLYQGRLPLWAEDELDASDRKAARFLRPA